MGYTWALDCASALQHCGQLPIPVFVFDDGQGRGEGTNQSYIPVSRGLKQELGLHIGGSLMLQDQTQS